MNRTEKMLEGLDLRTAVGLEVGALDNPIVPPDSPGIFYVDHVDTAALREKYKEHPLVKLEKLVEVHGVWGEKTLAEAAAAVVPVDFFVASHVIEHVPNLIGWLQEIATVLKPNGHVRLAIPDRRFTFDLLRRETGIAEVLAAHFAKARVPQVPQLVDHMENVAKVDAALAWAGTLDREAVEKHHSAAEMLEVVNDALQNGNYHDVHCWVFTPHSFAMLMGRLADLGYHSFACHRFHDTERNTYEFFVSMEQVSEFAAAAATWRALAVQIEKVASIEASRIAAAAAESAAAVVREPLEQKLALSQGDIENLRLEIQRQQAQIEALNATIAEIKKSTSWRVTAPLRALRRAWL